MSEEQVACLEDARQRPRLGVRERQAGRHPEPTWLLVWRSGSSVSLEGGRERRSSSPRTSGQKGAAGQQEVGRGAVMGSLAFAEGPWVDMVGEERAGGHLENEQT